MSINITLIFLAILNHEFDIQSFEFAFVREKLVPWIHSKTNCTLTYHLQLIARAIKDRMAKS